MIIANYMVSQTDLERIWFVISPQNPFKKKKSLARDYNRLHLVNLAIGDNYKLKSSNIEFDLPQPSYTIDSLTILRDRYPDNEFVLIMGGDNLGSFHKWKKFETILKWYEIYVYQRPNYDLGELKDHPKVHIFDAPQMNISASYIRKCIKEDKSIQYLVPDEVFEYISTSNLYKK